MPAANERFAKIAAAPPRKGSEILKACNPLEVNRLPQLRQAATTEYVYGSYNPLCENSLFLLPSLAERGWGWGVKNVSFIFEKIRSRNIRQ